MVKETTNPFESELDPNNHLYNIGTGKAASESTKNFLLNIEKNGNTERTAFISECVKDPARFEQRIKRQKLKNFASETGK